MTAASGRPYRRGASRERQLQDRMERDGWVVGRSAGSKGAFDLVAMKVGQLPQLIEVKSTPNPFTHFGPADRLRIIEAANKAGARAVLCHWPPDRQGPRFLHPQDWPGGDRHTRRRFTPNPVAD